MPRRHWVRLAIRVVRLGLFGRDRTAELVAASYDRIACGYDDAWTGHMRTFSLGLLDRLAPPPAAECIDLTCGTGFISDGLAQRCGGRVVGVDASRGMLEVARRRQAARCEFICEDSLAFLRARPSESADVVTCGWGLGYTRPLAVVKEAARVLRPGGRLAVIDNTLFSLAGVLWASVLAFAERPEALSHVMRVRFLPHSSVLSAMMRMCGLAVRASWDGSKTYHVASGTEAIARLTETGAAAGFEFAADPVHQAEVFARFGDMMEARSDAAHGIPITHRYLAVIGEKR